MLTQKKTLRNGKVIENVIKSDSKDSNRCENVINGTQSCKSGPESDSETIIDEEYIKDEELDQLKNEQMSEKSVEDNTDSNEESTNKYVVPQKDGYTCGYHNCGKWYRKLFYVKEHIHRHLGFTPFKCQYNGCNYRCVARAGMKRHIRDIHKTKNGKTRTNTNGINNDIENDYSIEHIIHKYIKEGYKCGFKDCGKQFKACRDLKVHIKRHLQLKPYSCKYQGCDYRCVEGKSLLPHVRTSHTPIKGLKCKECAKSLNMKTYFDLKCHKKTHKEFKCLICGKLFTRQCYLKVHNKRHTLFKFPCHFDGCGYIGSMITDLNRHIVNIHHNLINSLECKQCNTSFKTKFLYYSHKLKVRKKSAKYKCNKCGKTFFQDYQLYNHKRTHVETRPYICKVKGCQYRGKFYRDLRRHVDNLHEPTPNLKCNVCGIPIRTKFQLLNHKVKNHVERYFPCSHCGQVFLAKDVMSRHVIRKHNSTENQ